MSGILVGHARLVKARIRVHLMAAMRFWTLAAK